MLYDYACYHVYALNIFMTLSYVVVFWWAFLLTTVLVVIACSFDPAGIPGWLHFFYFMLMTFSYLSCHALIYISHMLLRLSLIILFYVFEFCTLHDAPIIFSLSWLNMMKVFHANLHFYDTWYCDMFCLLYALPCSLFAYVHVMPCQIDACILCYRFTLIIVLPLVSSYSLLTWLHFLIEHLLNDHFLRWIIVVCVVSLVSCLIRYYYLRVIYSIYMDHWRQLLSYERY